MAVNYVCVAFEDIAISAELSWAFSWADTSSMAELSEAILSARSCTSQDKSFFLAPPCTAGEAIPLHLIWSVCKDNQLASWRTSQLLDDCACFFEELNLGSQ